MNGINKLKQRLQGQESSENIEVYNLCSIMKLVGGYEQLMNLPLTAIKPILDYLEFVNKQQEKAIPKMRKR